MKKLFLLVLLVSLTTFGFSQKNWYQFGFKVSTNLPANRTYSDMGDYLESLVSADFGGFFRAGKYVCGEIGLGYTFYKGTYSCDNATSSYDNETVETRYLQLPIKVVGYVPLGQGQSALLPYVGIIYQPLIKVTDNEIDFSKTTIEKNMTLFTAGLDLKLGFIVLGANYRYSFQNFFQNKGGEKPQYVNLCVGFQF